MALTNAQLTTLKAAILAETNATFVGYRNNGQTTLMADWLNKDKSPAVNCWRTSVPPEDSDEATPWPSFDNLADGKRESWLLAFMRYPRNYTRIKVRKWITDTWGNATAGSNAETILTDAGLRKITRAEAILGGSEIATTGTVSALSLEWEGPILDTDIIAALSP